MPKYEIIDVVDQEYYLGPTGKLHRYSTVDGAELATGSYVVRDHPPVGELRFDRATLFRGPFPFERSSMLVIEQEM